MKESDQSPLTKLFYSVLGSLLVAATVGQYHLLFQLSERLTAVETQIKFLAEKNHIASNP